MTQLRQPPDTIGTAELTIGNQHRGPNPKPHHLTRHCLVERYPAKQVLAEVAASGGDPAGVAKRLGFEAMAADALEAAVDEVIAACPGEWARFCAGEGDDRKKMAGFLTGQVMRATRGRADGAAVNRLLTARATQ